MAKIAVVGADGYMGSALYAGLSASPDHTVAAVTRENYSEMQKDSYDSIINCAMPSARFWAKNNPEKDFTETVQKTADLVYGWKFGKFIQMSTVSARCQLDTVYGRHKAAAEKICGFEDSLIVRLGSLYSPEFKKGVLVDMLNGQKVYIDASSRYCFTHRDFVVKWLASHLDSSGIIEVGARNSITLREVADHLGGNIEFEGIVDHQEIENPSPDFPDAREVLSFLDEVKINFKK